MKAFSNVDLAPVLAVTITAALGAFFWFSSKAVSAPLAPAPVLEGKTWVLNENGSRNGTAVQGPVTQEQKSSHTEGKSIKKPSRRKKKNSITAIHPLGKPSIRSIAVVKASPAPAKAADSNMAVNALVSSGSLDGFQNYRLQDIIDRFEEDQSKYALNQNLTVGGVTLSFEGLQKRERFYVLKVSVDNETDADFFIRDFTTLDGNTIIDSRSLFRILVEPQRIREGYVIFEPPQLGTVVHVKLEEDGGNGRVLEAPVSYPF